MMWRVIIVAKDKVPVACTGNYFLDEAKTSEIRAFYLESHIDVDIIKCFIALSDTNRFQFTSIVFGWPQMFPQQIP